MKYLLLCCFDEKQWEEIPGPRRELIMRDYHRLIDELAESGKYLAGAKLEPSSTASTVRGANGGATVTDGPFAETKEQLGGYHLLECSGPGEALEIAGRIPTIPFGGAVEVRAVHA